MAPSQNSFAQLAMLSNPSSILKLLHPKVIGLPYPTANTEYRRIIDEQIQSMLDKGIIRHSSSEYASSVVLSDKKDGNKRFCIDFKRINAKSKPSNYPLPLIDDIYSQLAGSQVFSKIDCQSGYWQIPLDESSKHLTAFVTHKGLFEFNVMPFGLSGAASTFQKAADMSLADLSCFATAFQDDILIFSKSMEEHIKHLSQVLTRLKEHGWTPNWTKSLFAATKIEYCGYIITANGFEMDLV